MRPAEIRQQIAEIDTRLGILTPWHETLVERRQRYVVAGDTTTVALIERGAHHGDGVPFDLRGLDEMPGLKATESELRRLRERRALLKARLPTEVQVAAAAASARVLVEQAGQAAARFAEAWPHFTAAMAAAETEARMVVTARSEASIAIARLRDLIAEFGLDDVSVPEVPAPPRHEQKIAGLVASLLGAAPYGEIDSTTLRDLTAART